MKKLVSFLFFFIAISATSQDINQYDANGKRHGIWQKNHEGTKVMRYEGKFEHGKEVGLFRFYTNVEGKAILTITKDFTVGSGQSHVTYHNQGHIVSEGKMNGKKYVGKWVYYHNKSDKPMTVEHYNQAGQLHGKRTVFYPNGNKAEVLNYVNGKREGEAKQFSEDGAIFKEMHYKNDGIHGPFKVYDKAGNLSVNGQYRNNKKHGVWKYYTGGKLDKEKDFTVKSKNPYKKK